MNEEWKKYADIIDLPRHISKNRTKMSVSDRAAQFSPFAALTGHDQAIKECARLTDDFLLLSDEEQKVVNRKLIEIKQNIASKPMVAVTYFLPDAKKSGGKYVTAHGQVAKIKEYERLLILQSGEEISIDDILIIE